MRNGRLLVEKSPDALLKEHNTVLLESIVLKLCRNDMSGFGESHAEQVKQTLAENSFYSRRKNNFKPAVKLEITKEEDAVVGIKIQAIDENLNINANNNQNTLQGKRPLQKTMSIREIAAQGIWGKYCRVRALAVRNAFTLLRSPL